MYAERREQEGKEERDNSCACVRVAINYSIRLGAVSFRAAADCHTSGIFHSVDGGTGPQ